MKNANERQLTEQEAFFFQIYKAFDEWHRSNKLQRFGQFFINEGYALVIRNNDPDQPTWFNRLFYEETTDNAVQELIILAKTLDND